MPEIHGNLDGVRDSLIKSMEEMYQWPIGKDEFLPVELAVSLAEFSHHINREISLYISRVGEVLDVTVGNSNQVPLQSWRLRRNEKRLARVRCIHTHPAGSPDLSDVDLTAIRSLWLDAMAAIGIDREGRITGISAAFLGEKENGVPSVRLFSAVQLHQVPAQPWMREIENSEYLVMQGEEKPIHSLERALLIGIESDKSLDELEALCQTAGGEVVGRVLQNRTHPDGGTYLGSGRVEQLSLEAQSLEADVIIADDELTGMQLSNLAEATGLKVVDRTQLILDIFARRATSSEGKLQVELAQLTYNSSRLIGRHSDLSRLAGGIGTRGPGESKLEIDRRRIRERMGDLKAQLRELEGQRTLQRKSRQRSQLPVVALVGYTNTGKSTLLNRISGADVYVKDELFATLDAVSRRVDLPTGDAFILVDSVGFIRKLPTELIEAFHSTLEEAALADVLVIVSDASSADSLEQHDVVEQVLDKLEATWQPRIEVLNKCDVGGVEVFPSIQGAICVSALTGDNLDGLIEKIAIAIREREKAYSVMVPFDKYALLNDLRTQGRLVGEEHLDDGTRVSVMLDSVSKNKLAAKHGNIFDLLEGK